MLWQPSAIRLPTYLSEDAWRLLMICGSDRFYRECLAKPCKICGAPSGQPCDGEAQLERFVHMQRAPMTLSSHTAFDLMLHDSRPHNMGL